MDRCSSKDSQQVALLASSLSYVFFTVDLAADWLNYASFITTHSGEEMNIATLMMYKFLIVSSIFYGCICIILLLRIAQTISNKDMLPTHILCIVETLVSAALWFFEDVGIIILVTSVHEYYHCPLIEQFQTTSGVMAFMTSISSMVWRTISSLIFGKPWNWLSMICFVLTSLVYVPAYYCFLLLKGPTRWRAICDLNNNGQVNMWFAGFGTYRPYA